VLLVWTKKQLVEKKAEFWVQLGRGACLQAACDAVGVDRQSGRRWRDATGGRVPRKRPEPSGRYLSLDERLVIADLVHTGASDAVIATALSRSPSTISREMARNGSPPGRDGRRRYRPYAAQQQAELRGRRPKPSKFDNLGLATVVQAKLCVKWSPEQVSLHLAMVFGDRAEMQVSHETIYQALYVQGRGHLRADLHQHLRTGRAVRRPRGPAANRGSRIPGMILISERPAEVADRAVPGHWESQWCCQAAFAVGGAATA
jgi:IS30 family transposase